MRVKKPLCSDPSSHASAALNCCSVPACPEGAVCLYCPLCLKLSHPWAPGKLPNPLLPSSSELSEMTPRLTSLIAGCIFHCVLTIAIVYVATGVRPWSLKGRFGTLFIYAVSKIALDVRQVPSEVCLQREADAFWGQWFVRTAEWKAPGRQGPCLQLGSEYPEPHSAPAM